MLEALEKLRDWGDSHLSGEQEEFWSLYNGIRAEVNECYMQLPVDAEGMPIRLGDVLQLGDTRGEVVGFNYCPCRGELPWEWLCDTGEWHNTAFTHHVKPRTVEDVLQDTRDKLEADVYSLVAAFTDTYSDE